LGALRGREKTAENVLEAAGHRDPEMDGVTPDASAASEPSVDPEPTSDGGEDQSSLGDF
jgi:helicase